MPDKGLFSVERIDSERLAMGFGLESKPIVQFAEVKSGEKETKLQKLRRKIKEKKAAATDMQVEEKKKEISSASNQENEEQAS